MNRLLKKILLWMINLIFFLALVPLFADGETGTLPVKDITFSTTTDPALPVSNLFDNDYSSAWGPDKGTPAGWVEMILEKKALIYGIEFSAAVPPDAELSFQFYQNDEWHTFSSAWITGINEVKRFYDLSFDRVVTNRLALRIYGNGAGNTRVYELAVKGRTRENIIKISARIGEDWQEIYIDETDPYMLTFPTTVITNRIKVESSGTGPGELRILGSPTRDTPPSLSILWPEDGQDISSDCIKHGKVFGFIDNPGALVTVNEKSVEQEGQYFWIGLEELDITEVGFYLITATATDNAGRSTSHTVEVSVESFAIFRLDQRDHIIFTDKDSITISGWVLSDRYYVKVNDCAVTQSRFRFWKEIDLDEGFNVIKVDVFEKQTDMLKKTLFVRVVRCSTGIILTIDTPLPYTTTNTHTITVKGRVEGAGKINVLVNGRYAKIEGTSYQSKYIKLKKGSNTITVTARNKQGMTAMAQVVVNRDTVSPKLTNITPPQDSLHTVSTVTVAGTITETSKVWVSVNGTSALVENGSFSVTLDLPDGKQTLVIKAADAAGNKSSTFLLRVIIDTTPPGNLVITADPAGWTNNPRPVISFSATDEVTGIDHYELKVDNGVFTVVESPYTLPPQEDGEHTVFVKVVDKAGWEKTGSVKVYIDTVPPELPGYFRTVPGNGKIILKWLNPDEDAAYYLIYRDTDPDNPLANVSGSNLEYSDVQLENGTQYGYRMKAVDLAGNESPYSAWEHCTAGLEIVSYNPEDATIAEYDNVFLAIGKDTFELPDGAAVKEVHVSEVQSNQLEEFSYFGIISPIYHFKVIVEKAGEVYDLDHIGFNQDFVCAINYDESKIPMAFAEQNLGVYYFDPMWCRWFKVKKSAVDEENNVIYFAANHFSDFSIQPTALEDLTPQELKDVGYSPLKTLSTHEGVTVSPQGGSAQVQMTEMVLPGKNGFDFVMKRTYDSATARGDALGLSLNMAIKLNLSNLIGSIFDIGHIVSLITQGLSQVENQIKRYLQNNGDYSYSMGVGWRLNFPYIRGSNSEVLVRTPDGAFHSIHQMKVIQARDFGMARELFLENHENADFTLHIYQARINIDVTGAIMGQFQTPGWQVVYAKMTMKDGTEYWFDPLGRCTLITDAQGINRITFHYSNTRLDYIEDSMGRTIRFEYQSHVIMPRITKIWVENDPEQNVIEYTIRNGLIENTPINAPLLEQARDLGGRTYHYRYDYHFLFAGGGGIKVNFFMLFLDICTGGLASEFVSELGGPSTLTLKGNIQSEFIFLLDKTWGPGIGYTKIENHEETLIYTKIEPADFLLGFIPTGMDITYQVMKRIYTTKLELFEYYEGPHIKTTHYSYGISSAGDGQFYTNETSENDGRTRKEYKFDYHKKTRCRWVTWSDYAADLVDSRLFTSNPYYREVIPYNTAIHINDAVNFSPIESTYFSWYTDTMRLRRQGLERSEQNYMETNYTYDTWANPVYIKETLCAGDHVSITETFNHYFNTTSTPDEVFTAWPNPYSPPSLTREIRTLLLAQAIKNTPPAEAGLPDPVYLVSCNNYNSLGQLTASSRWTGTGWAETTYTYQPDHGSPETITKPDGHGTHITYDYDFTAHPDYYFITSIEEDVKDADGNTRDISTTRAFDYVYGNMTWEKNPRGYVTEYGYDSLGRIVKITEPDDDSGEQSWDPRHSLRPDADNNPITIIEYNDTEIWSRVTNALGASIWYDYDGLGRLVRIEKENQGNPAYGVIHIKNDPWDNIVEITDPNNHTTNYTYDATGRLSSIIHPEEEGTRAEHRMSFNYSENKLTTRDENNNITIDLFDMKDRLLKKTQYIGIDTIETFIYYDSLGNQVLTIDPLGNRTITIYDSRNLLSQTILPEAEFFENGSLVEDSPYIRYEYDLSGIKTRDIVDTPDGEHVIVYEADGLGRVIRTRTTYTDPLSGHKEAIQEVFYDDNGNQIKTIDAHNTFLKYTHQPYYTTEMTYSARDKVLIQATAVRYDTSGNVTDSGNRTIFTYDKLGNVKSMTDPRGASGNYTGDFTLVYHYDDLNRLVRGELPAGTGEAEKRIIEFIYDPRGNLLQRHEPDNARSFFTYTPRNKLHTETIGAEGISKTYTITHEYDPVGNEIIIRDNAGNETRKVYDEVNRVTQVLHPEGNSEWLFYDKNSNVIETIDGENHSTWSEYNPYKKLTAMIDARGNRYEYFYDRLGNKTKEQDPNRNTFYYEYDELNRLIKETTSLGYTYMYRYDEGAHIIETVDANGTRGEYTYTPGYLVESIAYSNNGETHTISYDYDEAGAVIRAEDNGVVSNSIKRVA